jgi:uncharacterized membrane protein HdeD (DUF308 family)
MTLPPQTELPDQMTQIIRSHRSRFTWLGIGLLVLGVLAILFPLLSSIALKLMLGWFFLIVGAGALFAAFQMRDWGSALWAGLIGLLHLAAGVYLAFFPLTGLIGLTLFVGLVFLAQGAGEAVMAWQHRPRDGWIWLGVSAVASFLLGVMLIAGLPGTALWALGLFLGINLISSGLSFVALARMP